MLTGQKSFYNLKTEEEEEEEEGERRVSKFFFIFDLIDEIPPEEKSKINNVALRVHPKYMFLFRLH